MIRFTLRYRTASGAPMTLYNLALQGARDVQRGQTALGSTGFQLTEQQRTYRQDEIDAMRADEFRINELYSQRR